MSSSSFLVTHPPRAPENVPEPLIGTLGFLVLHALNVLQSPYDSYVLCALLSLDSITLSILASIRFRWMVWQQSRR